MEYGIPLNVLLNSKINSDQTKTLNLKTLFPETDFHDQEVEQRLLSEGGLQLKLDSRVLKDFFEDFKETCMEGSKIIGIFQKVWLGIRCRCCAGSAVLRRSP